MSTSTFDESKIRRDGAGQFATKTMTEAPGGTEVDLPPTTAASDVHPSWLGCRNIALDQTPAWAGAGFTAQDADAWAGAGAGIDDALDYTAIGSTPGDVAHWRAHGFNDGAAAKAWVQAGNPMPTRAEDEWSEPQRFDSLAQADEYAAYSELSAGAFRAEMDERFAEQAAWEADLRELHRS